jgi:hypothetical protein
MIQAVICDEHGKWLSDFVDVPHGILSRVHEVPLSCLPYVDPYGDTMFNHLQLPSLRGDLQLLQAVVTDRGDIERYRNRQAASAACGRMYEGAAQVFEVCW